MAFPARGAVFRDEKLQIHGGRWADAPKPLKPSAKPSLQERKPLQDVSNVRKGTALKERSTLKVKERSALQSHEEIKNPNKTKIFVDKETAQCQEWATDGVEGSQLTRYDYQKSDKDVQDKRIKKKVEKVKSALHCWTDAVFDPVMYRANSQGAKTLLLVRLQRYIVLVHLERRAGNTIQSFAQFPGCWRSLEVQYTN
ncbi:hypothetical protein ACP4OV_013298 [Aristida adscensionis]